MIIYDLICSQGHGFEGWFKNLRALNSQIKKSLVECPVCGDVAVTRRPSTFGMVKSRQPAAPVVDAPTQAPGPSPQERFQSMVRQLEAVSQKLEREYDDVGGNFAREALKMHYGAAPRRNIRGLSTDDQENMLRKEGVEFFKVPMLTRKSSAPSIKNNN